MQTSIVTPLGGVGFSPSDGIPIASAAFTARRTSGISTYSALPVVPSPSEKWELVSVSVQGQLSFFMFGGPWYGRFGKIMTGLILHNPPFPQPQTSGIVNFPTDTSLTAPLWDPDVDPMPPAQNQGVLTVSSQINLPQPVDLRSFEQPPVVGLWMMPSLFGSPNAAQSDNGLELNNTTFTVVYEDGR